MNVFILLEVLEYLEDLVIILYDKQYFGFLESSRHYVSELIDDIKVTLPRRLHKPAPNYFHKYGKELCYVVFPKNNRTTWYVFFNKYRENGEITYLVRYIGNNHVIAQYL